MKHFLFVVSVAVMVFSVAVRAQTPGPQPGPEHKKLEVWAGTWTIQVEAKDSPSGPTYRSEAVMQGQWLPGGFFLEIHGTQKVQNGEDRFMEILGYDSANKTYFSYVFYFSGTWGHYTLTFGDRSCLESGTFYSPDGNATKFRHKWNFSPDGMSLTGTEEVETDGNWWTSFEAKGVKTLIK